MLADGLPWLRVNPLHLRPRPASRLCRRNFVAILILSAVAEVYLSNILKQQPMFVPYLLVVLVVLVVVMTAPRRKAA